MKRHQDCPTCRKPIEGKPIHSIVLDNAVGKLVELRVESFAERSRKKNSEASTEVNSVTKQYECGTQTTSPQQPRDSSRNKNHYNGGTCIHHFFHPQNGGPCHEFHFFNDSDYDDYSDDYDDYSDSCYDDDDDYNGLPGYYWGGHGCCFNCGKCIWYKVVFSSSFFLFVGDPFHWANGCPRW